MEEMKTIGFTQLKKVSVCRLCSGNPCKSNRANQRALLFNRRDLCSERRFDDSTVFIEDVSHITCQRYFKQKDFSRKFIPGTCVMNKNCWLELAQIRKRITESTMSMVFDVFFENCCQMKFRKSLQMLL
ncbi:hypothetical protein TNCT_258581 [Trichonephila clavata]|uniref:Uncharacterized protein n=1 Tax=Trichonephila clavata TaxID=2740835 RepID=A0A8X6HQV9_TRICU|nr:hypothetical protein TNCT_258581 [Trichonephila clavata]